MTSVFEFSNLLTTFARICAAANGFLGTMDELLLDQRVDLEVATRLGQTALFKAAPGWQKRQPKGGHDVDKWGSLPSSNMVGKNMDLGVLES